MVHFSFSKEMQITSLESLVPGGGVYFFGTPIFPIILVKSRCTYGFSHGANPANLAPSDELLPAETLGFFGAGTAQFPVSLRRATSENAKPPSGVDEGRNTRAGDWGGNPKMVALGPLSALRLGKALGSSQMAAEMNARQRVLQCADRSGTLQCQRWEILVDTVKWLRHV
jgi:hypothetical protein